VIYEGWIERQEGYREMTWHQAAGVMQSVYENNRNPKYRRTPFSSAEFLPRDLAAKAKREGSTGFRLTPENLRSLKVLFPK